jgi:hypothetical protein
MELAYHVTLATDATVPYSQEIMHAATLSCHVCQTPPMPGILLNAGHQTNQTKLENKRAGGGCR